MGGEHILIKVFICNLNVHVHVNLRTVECTQIHADLKNAYLWNSYGKKLCTPYFCSVLDIGGLWEGRGGEGRGGEARNYALTVTYRNP